MLIVKTIIVKDYIDADRLMKEGYICKGVDRNKDDRKRLIFFFDYSEELKERLIYYKNNKINYCNFK